MGLFVYLLLVALSYFSCAAAANPTFPVPPAPSHGSWGAYVVIYHAASSSSGNSPQVDFDTVFTNNGGQTPRAIA